MKILRHFCIPILAITATTPLFAQTSGPAPIEVMVPGTYQTTKIFKSLLRISGR